MTGNNNGLVEIRDSSGRLLFKYNPQTNEIEIKKGGDGFYCVELDEIRRKYGFLPSVPTPFPLGVEMATKKE